MSASIRSVKSGTSPIDPDVPPRPSNRIGIEAGMVNGCFFSGMPASLSEI